MQHLLNLLAAISLLVWGTHIVRTGILRVLGANLRREIYLIFKESVNNIVKHSNCAKVEINLSLENSEIRLNLHDDGAGFDTNEVTDGHGLASMKARADGLGGKLKIVSDGANGTNITLSAPLGAISNEQEKYDNRSESRL